MQTAFEHAPADAVLLEKTGQGDRKALHQLYLKHRGAFVGWACKRYQCTEEDAADLYQDAIIILYENARDGKVKGGSSVRTYLFGIGRNLILKQIEKYKRFANLDEEEPREQGALVEAVDAPIVLTERQQLIRAAIRELGEACRRLLIRFYYDRFSTEAIMDEFGYKTRDVVKSQKARCMRSLRGFLQDKEEFLRED